MKLNWLVFFLWMIVSFPAWAVTQEDAALFSKANQGYRKGDFQNAAQVYEELSRRYPRNAAIYYNLGNARYRLGTLGPAILAFERAKLFEPRNKDIRANLAYVRSLLEYRIDDKRNWYLKLAEKILEYFTYQEIFLWAMILYAVFVAGGITALALRRPLSGGWVRRTLLTLLILSALLALAKHIETRVIRDAVVMQPGVEVRYGPSDADQVAFRLGEGLEIYVLDRRSEWSRILLVNGEGGWVRNDQIMEVRTG